MKGFRVGVYYSLDFGVTLLGMELINRRTG